MLSFSNGNLVGDGINDFAFILYDGIDLKKLCGAFSWFHIPFAVLSEEDGEPSVVKVYTDYVFEYGLPKCLLVIEGDVVTIVDKDAPTYPEEEYYTNRTVLEYINRYFIRNGDRLNSDYTVSRYAMRDALLKRLGKEVCDTYTLEDIADSFNKHDIGSSIVCTDIYDYGVDSDDILEFNLSYKGKVIKNGYLCLNPYFAPKENTYFMSFILKDKINLYYKTLNDFIDAIEKGDFGENVIASTLI